MSPDGFFTEKSAKNAKNTLEKRESDSVFLINGDYYVLECQSFDDDSMALRIAEYTFLVARDTADYSIERAVITLPRFTVIYIKKSVKTPKRTSITLRAPDGQEIVYEAENVILDNFSKEYIIEKRLFPYIPFYITRYEAGIKRGDALAQAVHDLQYFMNELIRLRNNDEISDLDFADLKNMMNRIINHITSGVDMEIKRKELNKTMGGVVLELPSDSYRKGRALEIIDSGYEFGLSKDEILSKLQRKLGVSLNIALGYLDDYEHSKL
jgi:hypothetical protein